MNKELGILGLAIMLALSVNLVIGKSNSTENIAVKSHFKVTIQSGFSLEMRRAILQAASDWNDRYHCNREITVIPYFSPGTDKGNGIVETILDDSSPGLIILNTNQIISEMRNTVLHAMTHANVKDSHTILGERFSTQPGVDAYGYQGAAILVLLSNGEKSAFRKIEEAICERNASYFPGYTIGISQYAKITKLAKEHFTNDSIIGWVENNDVPSIVGSIVGRPPNEVTPEDIKKVMTMYMNAWNSQ